jgi:hypothetical protein
MAAELIQIVERLVRVDMQRLLGTTLRLRWPEATGVEDYECGLRASKRGYVGVAVCLRRLLSR